MMKRLHEVLSGHGDNYILPFFWQHGEEEALLREGMQRIQDAGIGAVCVESRPHPDFVGPKWWQDMDILLDEAKKRGMKLWILDDSHFPTGFVNGRLNEFPWARKRVLTYDRVDCAGPLKEASFTIPLGEGESFLGAVALHQERDRFSPVLEAIDLTGSVRDGLLDWDIPEGFWSLIFIRRTFSQDRVTHVDLLNRRAVELLLKVCYEPHYEHYSDEFGKTICGFFSDEPQLGNVGGKSVGKPQTGNPAMPLMWNEQLEAELRACWGAGFMLHLAACWFDLPGDDTPRARYDYMDRVSSLFRENFSEVVGGWCRSHGVEYIGHIIEDNNQHQRQAHGAAHYFRALWGQDMAGVDVVLQQIRPGFEEASFTAVGQSVYEGQFFHNLLGKLSSSLAHLDPKKKGRALCEIYGAFGWGCGLKLMKWLTDHMLVRGINTFVPHAFTMLDFPDPDCPPHFYARGNNPQYPLFSELMAYMNRVSHLISGGLHRPAAALLYAAESEWMDQAHTDLQEKLALELNRCQIDFEILPEDLLSSLSFRDGLAFAGEESFRVILVSSRRLLSEKAFLGLSRCASAGVPVLFIDQTPQGLMPQGMQPLSFGRTIALSELAEVLHSAHLEDIRCNPSAPSLRYYPYSHSDGELLLFFNEAPYAAADTWITLPPRFLEKTALFWYDAYTNQRFAAPVQNGTVHLVLAAGEALILIAEDRSCEKDIAPVFPALPALVFASAASYPPVDPAWTITLTRAGSSDPEKTLSAPLSSFARLTSDPYFSGTAIYENRFFLKDTELSKPAALSLGSVGETAEVWINGHFIGSRIAPPYDLSIDPALLQSGENRVRVRVINTLGPQQRRMDRFQWTMPLEPGGLLGPVQIKTAG